MTEPKQIIEKIRKIRFGIGLDTGNLTDEQKLALTDKNKILEDASKLAKEIHTKNPHFILELLQNAEDNEYTHGTPEIRFIINSDRLIIQNNERGFEEKNVWALCGIGETTKTRAMGYIGEKGIGFKSVFMVAGKVQIFSNKFQFEFNYDESKPLTMIIPEWIEEIPDFVDPSQTNIALYIKPELKNKIKSYIEEIHPSLLLFLNKLKIIEIEDDKSVIKIEKSEKDKVIEITCCGKKSYWKVVRKILQVSPDINEERRKGISETEIVLAFPLNEDGFADAANEQYVFAFLPVRKYGFKFIIQADFLLPITREDIIKDNKWNEWLRDSITELLLDAVKEFKNDDKLKYCFYDYLFLEEVKDEFFLPLVEQIYEKLRDEECILTETDSWKKPSDVLIGNKEIRELVPNGDLQEFLGKEYLSEKIKSKKSIFSRLGVRDFSIDDLIKFLEKTEWLKNQDAEWFARLFSYLSRKILPDEKLNQIKDLPIIKLQSGELTSINSGIVFFPLSKKVLYGFENELRVIDSDIIESILKQEKEEKDKTLEFLRKLGLKQSDPYEIIENHILPVYEKGEWKGKNPEILEGYIRYIKDNIDRYEKESYRRLNGNKSYWEPRVDPLKHLKESLLIYTNKNEYHRPCDIYLSKIYENENNLEELFDGIDVNFVHPCYVEKEIQQINTEISELESKSDKKEINGIEKRIENLIEQRNDKIKKWKDFFLKIGVSIAPKVEYYEGPVLNGDKYPTKDEMEHSTGGHKVKDWRLSREFTELLKRIDINKSKILITILDKYWGDEYSKYLKMHYEWFYRSSKSKTLPSSFIRDLKENIRVPTTQNTLAKPSETFLNKPEIQELLGDTVCYLAVEIKNEDFIKSIGINTEANVESVLNYLQSLVVQRSEDKEKFERLYKFLDEHFDKDETKIKEEFARSSLIFVPDTGKRYYNSKEVIWEDVSDVFGKNGIYLEKYYSKEFEKFFVEKLGISKKPTPEDYANVLCSISRKKKISEEDKKIILKIYEELNHNLDPNKVVNPISEQDWWNNFIKKQVFLTTRDEFWFNNGNIFVKDSDNLYEQFKDEEDIAFLWLPHSYNPDKIRFFIEACNIRYLSKSVRRKLSNLQEIQSQAQGDNQLTKRIQLVVPYVLRYLYWKESEMYEDLKNKGLIQKIKGIKVYVIDNLKVEYSINVNGREISKETEEKCVYYEDNDGGKLFKKKGSSIYDLAVEFSRVFGDIKGFDDFIMNLMNNPDNAEEIMKAKNIYELPEEEKPVLTPENNVEGETVSPDDTVKPPEKIPPEDVPSSVMDYSPKNDGGEEPPDEDPSPIEPSEPPSPEEKEIGRWGEEYALKCIKDEMTKKYPDASLENTPKGFRLAKDGKIIVEVEWLNREEEKGKPYDIRIVENGNEIFIEVKSTKEERKTWFKVSKNQWKLMKEKGDKFHIYRVYGAGTKEARVVKIENPAKLWLEGKIDAYPVRIEL